jgi:nucleolar GTP-binding protein
MFLFAVSRGTIPLSGILDHPLEERNTIEMQAIVALAHLQCSVLFFIDISEQCGYTVEQQCSLFRSIQPLFANKQLILVVNKVDQQPWETLDTEKKEVVQSLSVAANCSLLTMSNISDHGVSEVKTVACEKLLANRVDARVSGKKIDHVMNRLQVFEPKPRDNMQRPAYIPESVQRARGEQRAKPAQSRVGYAPTIHDVDDNDIDMERPEVKKLARELMWLNGGPGVYSMDYRDIYDLKDDSWKWDAIPEIIDGKNISDFVDPEILSKLEALEKEEEQIMAELVASKMEEEIESDLESEEEAAVEAIRERKKKVKIMKLAHQTQNKPMMPHAVRGKSKDKHDSGALSTKVIKRTLDSLGVDSSKMLERGRQVDDRERGRKRERSLSRRLEQDVRGDDDMDVEGASSETSAKKSKKKESATAIIGRARSHSHPRAPSQMGLKDESSLKLANKLEREGRRAWMGAAGEGDNRKSVHLVKWMNTGKRRGQKTSTIGR